MRAMWLIAGLVAAAGAAAADPEETRIEQLMTAPAAPVKPAAPAKPDKKAPAQTDNDTAAGLVGHRVAVETRQRGVFIGTLTSVTRDALILMIALPSRELSYTVPRGDVAAVTAR